MTQLQPLTLKLLKDNGVKIPEKLNDAIKDENKPFTLEEMRDWGFEACYIVSTVYAYLRINKKEYESRLFLADIIKPCVAIYAKHKTNEPNVVQNVIDVLKGEELKVVNTSLYAIDKYNKKHFTFDILFNNSIMFTSISYRKIISRDSIRKATYFIP